MEPKRKQTHKAQCRHPHTFLFPKFIASSVAEADLGALSMNVKEEKILRLTLEELGHKQPPTAINYDNSTSTIIAKQHCQTKTVVIHANEISLNI